MKAIILVTAVFVSSMASAMTCQDGWGNSATVNLSQSGVSINSARYGSTGYLAANGESGTSFYFRSQPNKLAIVNKTIFAGQPGKIRYSESRMTKGDQAVDVTFYCN